jgi:D-beta-D-heptose 7-phosphate kinase/D-beta-D-heptose 1-phosphate adenosyltransferase
MKKFCVVGDVLVDHYRVLNASRISPEAPVIVFTPENEYKTPGGAANVASNILSLTGKRDTVVLCSIVGRDWLDVVSDDMVFLPCRKRFIMHPNRRTTVKERLVTRRQQIARLDLHGKEQIEDSILEELKIAVIDEISSSDALIMSDYNHGVMQFEFVSDIMSAAVSRGIPVIIDSKSPDTIDKYSLGTIALPTKNEIQGFDDITRYDLSNDDYGLAEIVMKKMKLKALGMTMGRDGIILAERDKPTSIYPPLTDDSKNEVVDVTGAGDTVTAMVAIALAYSLDFQTAIKLANVAAGTVVLKTGVASADKDEVGQIAVSMGLPWPL